MTTAPDEMKGEELWEYLRNESIQYQQRTGTWPESTPYDYKFHVEALVACVFQPPAQIIYEDETNTVQLVGKLRKRWRLSETAADVCIIIDKQPFVGEMTLTFADPVIAVIHTNTFIRQWSNVWPN